MSIMAGADSCRNLYRLLRGEVLTYNEDFRENITFLRFDFDDDYDYKNNLLL